MTDIPPPDTVPFGTAVRYWFKLGCISFGGPAGQIAMMHQELVERRRWISERRFLQALNYTMVLPGPEAQQLATYVGWLMHGVRGGIVAGGLFVLPSLLLLILLSWAYMALGHLSWVAAILYGIKPAVVAIVAAAALRIGRRVLHGPALWAVACLSFLGIFAFAVPFPAIVLAAGLLGALGARYRPAWFVGAGGPGPASASPAAPALIGDDSPLAPHMRFSRGHTAKLALVGLLLWCLSEGLLWLLFGYAGPFMRMGWFFTKAAFVTFGGAYAVLPYVFDAAVNQHGWLDAGQMIDGLALGESTPGPLIMVVAFIGFVGGWTADALGGGLGGGLAGGAVGAMVATWFTFLPSFLFILLGAPLIEATRGQLHLAAPLNAITAAVVGVILNLAVLFAWHVFWPAATAVAPLAGGFDAASLLIALVAFALLSRGRAGVVTVIAGSAVSGLLLHLPIH